MFGVVDDFAAVGLEVGHGILDQFQVLVEVDAQDVGYVERPALPEDGDDFRAGLQKGVEGGVVLGSIGGPPGAAEGRDPGVLKGDVLRPDEEFEVFGAGRIGPSPFDIVHPQVIQPAGDQ